jgi:hypothetical protein
MGVERTGDWQGSVDLLRCTDQHFQFQQQERNCRNALKALHFYFKFKTQRFGHCAPEYLDTRHDSKFPCKFYFIVYLTLTEFLNIRETLINSIVSFPRRREPSKIIELDPCLHPQGVRGGCKGLKPRQHTLRGDDDLISVFLELNRDSDWQAQINLYICKE